MRDAHCWNGTFQVGDFRGIDVEGNTGRDPLFVSEAWTAQIGLAGHVVSGGGGSSVVVSGHLIKL